MGGVMSVFIRNNFKMYSALSDQLTQGGSLKDCGPVAVRAVYRFFGIKCNITYKDFIETGYFSVGGGGSSLKKFVTHKSLGLLIKTLEIKDKADFMSKIKSARKNNHPIIGYSKNHAYTIIPHDIVTVQGPRYDINTGQPLIACRRDRAIRFYLNKTAEPYTTMLSLYKGFKNLAVCFNSRFYDFKDCVRSSKDRDIAFVEIESIWKKFEETGCMYLYEIEGVKVDIEKLRETKYEWGSIKKEYKKIKTEGYKYLVDDYNYCCGRGFYWAQCDHFYEEAPEDRYKFRTKAAEHYSNAGEALKKLYKRVFIDNEIGRELKEKFNKNLPALYEKKEIIEYVKH